MSEAQVSEPVMCKVSQGQLEVLAKAAISRVVQLDSLVVQTMTYASKELVEAFKVERDKILSAIKTADAAIERNKDNPNLDMILSAKP